MIIQCRWPGYGRVTDDDTVNVAVSYDLCISISCDSSRSGAILSTRRGRWIATSDGGSSFRALTASLSKLCRSSRFCSPLSVFRVRQMYKCPSYVNVVPKARGIWTRNVDDQDIRVWSECFNTGNEVFARVGRRDLVLSKIDSEDNPRTQRARG